MAYELTIKTEDGPDFVVKYDVKPTDAECEDTCREIARSLQHDEYKEPATIHYTLDSSNGRVFSRSLTTNHLADD